MNISTGAVGTTFWPDITLDLAGATLLDFDLGYGELLSATFADAVFLGNAQFEATRFIAETDALVRTDVEPLPRRIWPSGYAESDESGPIAGLEGTWARIVRT